VVYKKYIKKGGKIFGPYLYQTRRINGKIITTYVGKYKENADMHYIILAVLGIALAIILFYVFYNLSPTGRAVLDIKSEYKHGDILTGNMNLILREGEIIPKDAKVVFVVN